MWFISDVPSAVARCITVSSLTRHFGTEIQSVQLAQKIKRKLHSINLIHVCFVNFVFETGATHMTPQFWILPQGARIHDG